MIETFWQYEHMPCDEVEPLIRRQQQYYWQMCQKELFYALGRIATCDAVSHVKQRLDVSEARLAVWNVYCAFGFLNIRTSYPDMFTNFSGTWNNPVLQKQVADVLERHFTLTEEDIAHCFTQYEEDLNAYLMLGWESEDLEDIYGQINEFGEISF